MQTSDSGGSSETITMGRTAESMCAISPSDLVGTIGNLISRIENLELALSQVLGANLHANTLGDLSSQVGWVYGVEYMGVPGWIQTEYGTLIPPPGFTLSGSGIQMWNACTGTFQDFQAVVMDEDGVLQWGADSIGGLCGEKVEQWDEAYANATPDYFIYRQGVSMATGSPYTAERNITLTSSSGLATDTGWTITATVANDGLYLVTCSSSFTVNIVAQGSAVWEANIDTVVGFNNYGNTQASAVDQFAYYGGAGDPTITVEPDAVSPSNSTMVDLPAGAQIVVNVNVILDGGASITARDRMSMTVTRLGRGSI